MSRRDPNWRIRSTPVIAHALGGREGGREGDFAPVRARERNSGVREKTLFCRETNEIICNYARIKFLTWPYEPEKDLAASRKPRVCIQLKSRFFVFLHCNVALYYESEFWTVSVLAGEKTGEMLHWGA